MHQLIIRYYKPYQSIVDTVEDGTEHITAYITTMIQSKLKNGKKNLPMMPRIHALAILHLTRLCVKDKNYLLLPLAMYLSLHLTKNNPSQISLRIQDIADDLGMSDKSIVKNLKILESLGYIKSIAQSVYHISPKLAFYGSSVPWSLSLQCEEENMSTEETKILIDNVEKETKLLTEKYIKNKANEPL